MPTHAIRLRGPWEFETLTSNVTHPAAKGRVQMPCDWGATHGADFRGEVLYTRSFGKPTGLDNHCQVWLVFDHVDGAALFTLNEKALGDFEHTAAPVRFDITALLAERNQLQVLVALPRLSADAERSLRGERAGLPGGLVGEIRLEIISPS